MEGTVHIWKRKGHEYLGFFFDWVGLKDLILHPPPRPFFLNNPEVLFHSRPPR
jgi:hypothetical protein